ncbi:hypothetical protein EOPP23_09975 [Endozoicomonas sp. OPT23]|nr:hypothetical protein [Endozoicomonas sp. OPT23]
MSNSPFYTASLDLNSFFSSEFLLYAPENSRPDTAKAKSWSVQICFSDGYRINDKKWNKFLLKREGL